VDGLSVERGRVTELRGDRAIVRLIQPESCDECSLKVFCRPGADGSKEVLAENTIEAKVGQTVGITEKGYLLLKLSIMQFGVPLLGLLIGVFGVYSLDLSSLAIPEEILQFLGGVFGLAVGGGITWIWSKHLARKTSCVFIISSIKPA
jgi:positive regulator of sigma E activity